MEFWTIVFCSVFAGVPFGFFLHSMNVERDKGLPWGDCFLRAFTRAAKVLLIELIVSVVFLIALFVVLLAMEK